MHLIACETTHKRYLLGQFFKHAIIQLPSFFKYAIHATTRYM